MKNRVKELRTTKSWSQRKLAEVAGTSQQQIQRIEAGLRKTRLDLALQISQALGSRVEVVFPGSSPAIKEIKRANGYLTKKAKESLDGTDIDSNIANWSVRLIIRGGAHLEYRLSSESDATRLGNSLRSPTDKGSPFCLVEGEAATILVNRDHVIHAHVRFDPSERTQDTVEDGESVVAYMANIGEPLIFDEIEPDYGMEDLDEDDPLDVGQLRFIQVFADSGLDREDFFSFVDANGEEVFLRAGEVAVLEIPFWLTERGIDPPSYGDEEEGKHIGQEP